nr:hypothetical protein [Tanacetum cinerariifolium]
MLNWLAQGQGTTKVFYGGLVKEIGLLIYKVTRKL